MEKLNFKFIFSELEKIRDKVVKEYMEIYNARTNADRIPIFEGDIFGNRIGNAIDYLNDVCGCAWIGFKDKRSGFYKQYKQYIRDINNSPTMDAYIFSYPHSGRQELEVNEAVAKACCEYINKNCGANCFVRSRID